MTKGCTLTCTTSSLSETHLGTWSPLNIRMLVPVSFLISEIIAPPFPNKQPTWLFATTSLNVISDLVPKFIPEPASRIRSKTRTTAVCAGDFRNSRFYILRKLYHLTHILQIKRYPRQKNTQLTSNAVIVIIRSLHSATFGPTAMLAPLSF